MATVHAKLFVRNMYRVCIIRPTEKRAVILSNESTFAMKHLNRVPVKAKMGRASRPGEKIHKMALDVFLLKG